MTSEPGVRHIVEKIKREQLAQQLRHAAREAHTDTPSSVMQLRDLAMQAAAELERAASRDEFQTLRDEVNRLIMQHMELVARVDSMDASKEGVKRAP